MRGLRIYLSLILGVSLISCEDVVQVDLGEGTIQLVVDAWVSNDSTEQKIQLSRSTQYYDEVELSDVVDATVRIYELSVDQSTYTDSFIFTHKENGLYTYTVDSLNPVMGVAGNFYELSIQDGSDQFKAVTELKRAAIVDNDSAYWFYDDGSTDILTQAGYYIDIYPYDPVGAHDIYWIRTYRNDTMFNDPTRNLVAYDGAFGHPSDFDGMQFIPPLRFGVNTFQWKEGDTAKIEYMPISIAANQFLLAISDQYSDAAFALFARPISNLNSNIMNVDTSSTVEALGFFNIGETKTIEIVIGDPNREMKFGF